MLKNQHKTLARTLAFIGHHSPGEFGLFWDRDGTMPWKEFYWALQEEPDLRFVREATIRELSLLGIDLPFALDGKLLRLKPGVEIPIYPPAANIPERLYFCVRSRNLVQVHEFGLPPGARRFIPACSSRELATRIARRREPEPVLIEIYARQAADDGISFLVAGPQLFLADAIPPRFLIIPKIPSEQIEKPAEKRKKPAAQVPSPSPGSFVVQPHHLQSVAAPGDPKSKKKGGKSEKSGWKKDSRKERRKRDI